MSYQIDHTTWRSPNHSARTQTPNTLVVHSCEGAMPSPRATSLPWLCSPRSKVSTHYSICRDTTIYQLVDDMRVANHAGGLQSDGTWTAQEAYSNPYSLGVELEHRRGQDWPGAQKDALAWLLRALSTRWRFPIDRIETHGQIAIKGPYKRKTDPTDWPHAAFVAWRNAALAPLVRTVTAGPRGAIAQQDRRPDAPTAGLWYPPGSWIQVDDLTNGYWHAQDGIGFIPRGQVEE